MSAINKLPTRPGGKFLKDIELDEKMWKPDFDIVSRYQSFETEIIRLSLLGIAGYGFLISQIEMPDRRQMFQTLKEQKGVLLFGLITLGLSLTIALAHRFLSTSCLFHQINILRGLKRLENEHWTEEEKNDERKRIEITRLIQRRTSRTCHYSLMVAAGLLGIGLIMVVIAFYNVLNTPLTK
jgi:hypothetical protein